MKLSTKCRYGARAMVEIARNFNSGVPTKRKDITAHQGVPGSYLENILISLKNSGLVITVRGPKGGFSLRRPPQQITMLEVVESLQGSLAPVDCLDGSQDCHRANTCVTRSVWQRMREAQEEVLRSVTIQDLVNGEEILQKKEYDFSI